MSKETNQAQQAKEFINNLNNTKDHTDKMDPKDIADNKVMAILSYLWILILVPIFAAKGSKFARFHVNQALILVIASIIFSVLAGIFTSILWILGLVFGLIDLGFIALMILGIVNAAQGRAKELPIFGKFHIFD